MHKEFVLYEEGLDLKKLGFDGPCFVYDFWPNLEQRTVVYHSPDVARNWNNRSDCVSLPSYRQVFRWIRDNFCLILDIVAFYDESQLPLNSKIKQKPKGYFIWDNYDSNFSVETAEKFESYEEAELICLKKLIKITKTVCE